MTDHAAPSAPRFCPAADCRYHTSPGPDWHWVKTGHYRRLRPPWIVQRYRCSHCRRSFSDQTFRVTYWLRRPELLLPVFHRLVGCSAFRQIAREFEVSPSTIATHAARLGRHCLLFHWRRRPRGAIAERLVLDGFQSFEWSQYHPTTYHLVAGGASHYCYGFTDSELRRSGRMTTRQRRRRAQLEAQLGRPDPRSVERDVASLLGLVAPEPQALELDSDEHHDYPRALRRVRHLRVHHRMISSREVRTPRNPLFPVNLLDLLIRHMGANHKRETIAFSKRRQSGAERLWVFVVWRNWAKWFSERRREGTPAMRLGLTGRRWRVPEILGQRLFPSRVGLPERWGCYYWREPRTRAIANCRVHRLRYAV
jgi:transposase-like protein